LLTFPTTLAVLTVLSSICRNFINAVSCAGLDCSMVCLRYLRSSEQQQQRHRVRVESRLRACSESSRFCVLAASARTHKSSPCLRSSKNSGSNLMRVGMNANRPPATAQRCEYKARERTFRKTSWGGEKWARVPCPAMRIRERVRWLHPIENTKR
jgi:hypothetical protein